MIEHTLLLDAYGDNEARVVRERSGKDALVHGGAVRDVL